MFLHAALQREHHMCSCGDANHWSIVLTTHRSDGIGFSKVSCFSTCCETIGELQPVVILIDANPPWLGLGFRCEIASYCIRDGQIRSVRTGMETEFSQGDLEAGLT